MDSGNRVQPLAEAASLLWPLVFVPITLAVVGALGHAAGNVLLGVLFLYLVALRSDGPTRRLMVSLSVMGMIFETANVASGVYHYSGTIAAPMWIALGWGILGWWTVRIERRVASLKFPPLLAATAIVLAAASVFGGTLSFTLPVAIAGLYVIFLSSRRPFAVYAFTAAFSIIAEYSGTAWGAWKYFDPSGSGAAIPPDLASLALAYATVMMFCGWISGFEPVSKATA